jgi:hypothetical protein
VPSYRRYLLFLLYGCSLPAVCRRRSDPERSASQRWTCGGTRTGRSGYFSGPAGTGGRRCPAPACALQQLFSPDRWAEWLDHPSRWGAGLPAERKQSRCPAALLLGRPWPEGAGTGSHVAGAAHKGRHRILLTSRRPGSRRPRALYKPSPPPPPPPYSYEISCPLPQFHFTHL